MSNNDTKAQGGALGFGGTWFFGILDFWLYSMGLDLKNPLNLGFFKSLKIGVIGLISISIISGIILSIIKKNNETLYRLLWEIGYKLCYISLLLAVISPLIPLFKLIMMF
ncbi:hypothetical protein [Cetobacterium sp. SF1]|uniref:hypothetical protein n=1 Tax=Cetobacterium sp. SF1 TaxID=3417654 RepID=UPI003CFAE2BD